MKLKALKNTSISFKGIKKGTIVNLDPSPLIEAMINSGIFEAITPDVTDSTLIEKDTVTTPTPCLLIADELQAVSGVGPSLSKSLVDEYKTVDNLLSATPNEIAKKIKGISRKKAKDVLSIFQKGNV